VFPNTHVNEGKRNSKQEIQPYFMKEITKIGYDFQSMTIYCCCQLSKWTYFIFNFKIYF